MIEVKARDRALLLLLSLQRLILVIATALWNLGQRNVLNKGYARNAIIETYDINGNTTKRPCYGSYDCMLAICQSSLMKTHYYQEGSGTCQSSCSNSFVDAYFLTPIIMYFGAEIVVLLYLIIPSKHSKIVTTLIIFFDIGSFAATLATLVTALQVALKYQISSAVIIAMISSLIIIALCLTMTRAFTLYSYTKQLQEDSYIEESTSSERMLIFAVVGVQLLMMIIVAILYINTATNLNDLPGNNMHYTVIYNNGSLSPVKQCNTTSSCAENLCNEYHDVRYINTKILGNACGHVINETSDDLLFIMIPGIVAVFCAIAMIFTTDAVMVMLQIAFFQLITLFFTVITFTHSNNDYCDDFSPWIAFSFMISSFVLGIILSTIKVCITQHTSDA